MPHVALASGNGVLSLFLRCGFVTSVLEGIFRQGFALAIKARHGTQFAGRWLPFMQQPASFL
eukprot:scaffold221_cov351-Pavlova_lutheri.AAC.28